MKYTGINIGPIVDTLMLARKPKELWTASYMFSYLMECILKEVEMREALGLHIVSPALSKVEDNDKDDSDKGKKEVGLYPDRVFIRHEGDINISDIISKAKSEFKKNAYYFDKEKKKIINVDENYFNVITATTEKYKDDGKTIMKLNSIFDRAELANRTIDDEVRTTVMKLLKEDKPFKIDVANPSIGDIAMRAKGEGRNASYKKYICIVQADGDKMGKTIEKSANNVGDLSEALLRQGKAARDIIEKYGGEPIYIGGDDLLFLAPVVSKDDRSRNIFSLLKELDDNFKKCLKDIVKELEDEDVKNPSMSFGLSITYNKYPLYEALKAARELLFDKAKKEPDKDAIAWRLRKHSGSGFEGIITQGSDVAKYFDRLFRLNDKEKEKEETEISAIAHKLRENIDLLELIREEPDQENRERRIRAFYKTMLNESNAEEKDPKRDPSVDKTNEPTVDEKADENKKATYTQRTRELLLSLFEAYPKPEKGEKDDIRKKNRETMEKILETMYGMLRTAKFINGEHEENLEDKKDE